MKSRYLSGLLASLIACSLAAGCSTPGGAGTPSAAGASGSAVSSPAPGTETVPAGYSGPDADIVNPKGVFPIVKEPVTLQVAMAQNPKISSYDDNQYTKLMEGKSGIDLVFDLLPAKDAASKIKLMFASDDLPEVFMGGGIDDASILEYGSQGLILPLNPLIEQFGDEVYNMWEKAEDKNLKSLMTSADGNIYSMPKYSEQYINTYNQRCFLYHPWMQKLNLKPAETLDEYVEILKAFKEKDPNGNGKADEIPLIGHSGGSLPILFFMNSFVYWDTTERLLVNDGVVSPAFTTPEFKEGLQWLHSLVEQGLFDPLTFTQDEAQLKAIMNQDDVLVGSFAQNNKTGVLDTRAQRSKDYVGQPPMKGPKGVSWMPETPPQPQHNFQITNKCAHPAAAYRLADMMLNQDITVNARYGFEGQDWKWAEDGKLGLDGNPAKREYITEVWQMSSQNVHWQWPNPGFMKYGTNEGFVWNEDPFDYQYSQLQYSLQYIKGKQPPESVPAKLIMSAEEMDQYATLQPLIKTYRDENITKFIVGDRSFDEWDAYLAEFDKMNLKEYIRILQSAYDRTVFGNE